MEKGRKPIKAQIPRRQQSPSPGRHRQQSPPISVYRAPSEEEKIRWRRARFFGRDEVVISRVSAVERVCILEKNFFLLKVWNPSDEFAHTLPSNDPHLPNDKQAVSVFRNFKN